jgi:hypothetical protein
MSRQPIFDRQQARKRAEINFGPWAARLAWLTQSRLLEERRALRYDTIECSCGRHNLNDPPFDGFCDND